MFNGAISNPRAWVRGKPSGAPRAYSSEKETILMQKQIAAWGLVVVISAGLGAAGALRAAASTNGRRNTTIVLGAATVGAALTHHKTAAILLGAGTAVSYVRYRDAVRRD